MRFLPNFFVTFSGFIAFVLASFVINLEGGSTFNAPHPSSCESIDESIDAHRLKIQETG
jgi:hypothetical protein